MENEMPTKEKTPYRLLMITADPRVFDLDSAARREIQRYGTIVEELYVIVFSKKKWGITEQKLAPNVWAYPTNSKKMIYAASDAVRVAKAIIGAKNIHLMIASTPFGPALSTWMIARETGTPFEIHLPVDVFSEHFRAESVSNFVRFWLAKFLLPKAVALRPFSARVKDSIYQNVHFTLGKIPYIYQLGSFVDVEAIRCFEPKKDLRMKYRDFPHHILIVAHLEKEKNVLLALAALRVALGENPDWGVVIVGAGSREKFLKKKVRKFELLSRVIFEAWTDDVISYYKTSGLFLSTANHDGFGKPLLEAAASGCPIITTDVGIVGDLLPETDVALCEPKNVGCIYQRLFQMMNDSVSYAQLQDHAKLLQEKLPSTTEDAYLSELAEHWKKVILK